MSNMVTGGNGKDVGAKDAKDAEQNGKEKESFSLHRPFFPLKDGSSGEEDGPMPAAPGDGKTVSVANLFGAAAGSEKTKRKTPEELA